MIIVDFSNLSLRNLFTSVFKARGRKENGKFVTEDFIGIYFHQMFASLNFIRNQFGRDKEMILAIDSKKNWRKEVDPFYKGHRKKNRDESEVNFDEFFKYNDELISSLRENFKFSVVEVERAEADDIIFVLSEKFRDKVTIISCDKDFKICTGYGSKLYRPIKKNYVTLSPEELSLWIKTHIVLGDEADGVPHIKYNTTFTNEYKEYLHSKDIFVDEYEYDNLPFEQIKELEENYDVWYVNKKGDPVEKKIFKKHRFGEKTAEKFAKELEKNLAGDDNQHKLLRKNFVKNKMLIHPSGIPADIKENILEAYNDLKTNSNYNK
jgi:5'-3' exonuclease